MAAVQEVTEQFKGKQYELHLSPHGLALTRKGEVPPDPNYQAAGYEEVASAELNGDGRNLMVVFAGDRPTWVIAGMNRAEAAWAQVMINQATERARLYKEPSFTQRLTGPALDETLTELAQRDPPQPVMVAELLLAQAVLNRATDVHLQPEPDRALIRYRIDGHLSHVATLSPERAERVISCLKVRGGMKTFQRNLAQTGRSTLTVQERAIDLRLTCLPTTHGEKMTVRLFDPAQAILDLETLGMDEAVLAAYRDIISQPQGCILLTGPAGCGKTTTMYASLSDLCEQEPHRSLSTIEEPVELELPGVDQTEVNRDVGLDFAEGLRSLLRQDPQILMVGEIRDPETAKIATQAGLTGHLVFSTVHAPSAAGVFSRLTQIGVEPYLVASSVTAVVTQRLVRKVCEACAEPYTPSPSELHAAGLSAEELRGANLRRGRGCQQCGESGYYGRTGLFALLPVTRRLREAIVACRPLAELEHIAAQDSIGSLWEAGLGKVRQGITTLEELQAVLGRQMV